MSYDSALVNVFSTLSEPPFSTNYRMELKLKMTPDVSLIKSGFKPCTLAIEMPSDGRERILHRPASTLGKLFQCAAAFEVNPFTDSVNAIKKKYDKDDQDDKGDKARP